MEFSTYETARDITRHVVLVPLCQEIVSVFWQDLSARRTLLYLFTIFVVKNCILVVRGILITLQTDITFTNMLRNLGGRGTFVSYGVIRH